MAVRAIGFFVAVATFCLFLGFWAFAYREGYAEVAGSLPVQSWPFGAGLFAAAGASIVAAVRRSRPALRPRQLALGAGLVALVLAVGAFVSLDAGIA